jgi:hypothetical protein
MIGTRTHHSLSQFLELQEPMVSLVLFSTNHPPAKPGAFKLRAAQSGCKTGNHSLQTMHLRCAHPIMQNRLPMNSLSFQIQPEPSRPSDAVAAFGKGHTRVNVKLLLPSRQSRGISLWIRLHNFSITSDPVARFPEWQTPDTSGSSRRTSSSVHAGLRGFAAPTSCRHF